MKYSMDGSWGTTVSLFCEHKTGKQWCWPAARTWAPECPQQFDILLWHSLKNVHSVPNNPSLKPQLTPKGFANRHQGSMDGTKHTVLLTMAILCMWSQVVLWTTICSSNDPLPELHMDTKIWERMGDLWVHAFPSFPCPFPLCAPSVAWTLPGWPVLAATAFSEL